VRRLPRILPASAADVDAKLFLERDQPALQRADALVVIPDECQSMPITAPNDWNQNG
jgi:hypothetical protein